MRLDAATLPVDQHRWLFLAIQLPAHPSNARVKVWRRLHELGALAVKNAVYVLPRSSQTLEDFSWIREQVVALKGQAVLVAASSVDATTDQQLVSQFRRLRSTEYAGLLSAIRRATRRPIRKRDDPAAKQWRVWRADFDRIAATDFFSAAGREDVEDALATIEAAVRRLSAPSRQAPDRAVLNARDFKGRIWVTRPRPGVDRFASAWLISRFIDRDAQFEFASDADGRPEAVMFDVFGGQFSHEGDLCTFEVLQRRFGIDDPGVSRIAEIVHDVDLKDARYRSSHAATVAALVDGWRDQLPDDGDLLRQGMQLFEGLYRGVRARAASTSTRKARR